MVVFYLPWHSANIACTVIFIIAGITDWLLADNSLYADLWIAGSALVSFLLSLWLINKVQSQLLLSHYARPVVVRKI